MAGKAVRKIEEQLNCSICLDIYTDPKQLHCSHVFCQKCLVKLVVRDQQGQLTLTCPTCREVTPVPANGVAGLKAAFHINTFLEVRDFFKQLTLEGKECHGGEVPSKEATKVCSEHSGGALKFYCESCLELICLECAVKGGKHFNHEYDFLSKAYERCKGEIVASLEPMEKQLSVVNETLAQLDTCISEVLLQQAAVKADIHSAMKVPCDILKAREKELATDLHQVSQAKLKPLSAQRDQMKTTQVQLNSYLGFMKGSLSTGSQLKLLKIKPKILKRVKKLQQATFFRPEGVKLDMEAGIVFSTLLDLPVLCAKHGLLSEMVSFKGTWQATGKALDKAVENSNCSFTLQALGMKEKSVKKLKASLKCELVSQINGTVVVATIEPRGDNFLYEVTFKPTVKGRHQLKITYSGQDIVESPYNVVVTPARVDFKTAISTIPDVETPWGIAFTQAGEIVVSERGKNCVSIFSQGGEKLRSFGLYGCEHGQFNVPYGVAVDNLGNILVADGGNHRIQMFTSDGEFLATVGSKGDGHLQFNHPTGIAFNTLNNKIYVVDRNHRIQILNSDLTFFNTIGQKGSREGQFFQPWGVACDKSLGRVFVADSGNERIQVFTNEGTFSKTIPLGSHYGLGVTAFHGDKVCISDGKREEYTAWNDHFKVKMKATCCVMVFSEVSQNFDAGVVFGELIYPCGVALDESGVLAVCDSGTNSIVLF